MFRKKIKSKKTYGSAVPFLLLTLFILSMFPVLKVSAAGGLSIYTTYPSISVKPGENVQTDITVSNATGSGITVALEVLSLPKGWEAYIEGGGRIIDKVYVSEGERNIDFTLKVPKDVKEGKYDVTLGASSGSYSDQLNLEYNMKADLDNKGMLTTNYTELKGSSDTSFQYEVEIKNNKNEPQTYSLGADVDRGWQVKFSSQYDSKQVASIPIEANKSATLKVEVIPPAKVNAGEYVIPIVAASTGETLSAELKVIITGSYGMALTTPTGRLNAETTVGKEEELNLVIQNTGSSDLQGVKLSSWQPDGWKVRFDKEIIDIIPTGESAEVKAYITSDDQAISGDYVVEITADTPEATSSAEFRVMVKTSTMWGLVGLTVILLLAMGLYWIFNTYGRR